MRRAARQKNLRVHNGRTPQAASESRCAPPHDERARRTRSVRSHAVQESCGSDLRDFLGSRAEALRLRALYPRDKLRHAVKKNATTAALLRNLDSILREVQQMEDTVRDAPRDKVMDADRRRLRWEIVELRRRAEFLMNWLSEARLESEKH